MTLVLRRFCAPLPSRCTRTFSSVSSTQSSLPFPAEKAKFYRELDAAVDVVERACRLCVDVKKSLIWNDGRVLEKNDQTPVTIADFGVQALISLGLKKLFPLVPLVAEEDSAFLRSGSVNPQKDEEDVGNFLLDSVVSVVADQAGIGNKAVTLDDVLEAIDRGGKDAVSFGSAPATYWVLDPIDGTRGFLKGNDALYVVGLALVVDGKIALGVMGCPNWKEEEMLSTKDSANVIGMSGSGIIMMSHVGCGTWTRRFRGHDGNHMRIPDVWERCFVDTCNLVHDARFCSPDSQKRDSLLLSTLFGSTSNREGVKDDRGISLIPTCCGSLCKYMMVASGRASVFIQQARAQTLIKVWDHAVGVVCVNEAGGQVTDWKGNPLDLADDQVERRMIFPSGGILVSNGNLHKQLLEMVSSNSLPVV